MLLLENISKSYGRNQVLDGINLHLNNPGITAILGPNASGKTTLLKCILDMALPDQGAIYLAGEGIRGQHHFRSSIGHLPKIAHFPPNLTCRQIIRLIKRIRGEASFETELVDLFGLEQEMAKRMRTLSGGTKQKLNLVVALMFDCPIIILDEPSTGLDPLALRNLKQFLRRRKSDGAQILITTHIMSLVQEIADYIVFLLDGKIYFDGPTSELLALQREDTLEDAIATILATSSS